MYCGNELQHYFDIVTAYPDVREYYGPYLIAAATNGGLDATLSWNLHHWDFAGIEVLAEEAGGVWEILREFQGDDGYKIYCLVNGKKWAVEKVAKLVRKLIG